MSDMIQYFSENRDGVIAVITSVVAVASAICALTPTPKDDSLVRKLYILVEWLALNVGKAKDK
jgi:predicted membrane channel-forming protein YqfA (hemolysin III family)